VTAPGCGCLDPAVFGHVCGKSGLPAGGWPDRWRTLTRLADPAPRPDPRRPGREFTTDDPGSYQQPAP